VEGLVVEVGAGGDASRAQELAARLGVPVALAGTAAAASGLCLLVSEKGLSLEGGGMSLAADLSRMVPRLRAGNLNRELVVRAARIRGVAGPLTAVDATAGMGEDSLLLAAAGFSVTLFERDPVICALLGDALARAAADPALAEAVSRMELRGEDSVPALPALGFSPDVVLLDPMFPERRKSAAVKKKLQLIQRLERPCDDEHGLMDAARAAGPRRIVVKRPAKGPWLAGEKPSYTVAGKAIRYDCYAL
jgi:16S rRNA (guanine1516-N2)-methyltransferase